MLAETAPVGDNILLIVGPLVVALALVAWLGLTAYAARKRARTAARRTPDTAEHRGPVRGGVIEGDPGQRNRRDEAPHD
jgi:hypothetical protein